MLMFLLISECLPGSLLMAVQVEWGTTLGGAVLVTTMCLELSTACLV